MIKQPLNHI